MAVDRFELMRQRTRQQGQANVQDQSEAMKRRFAAAGGLSSGAGMKAENQVEQAGARQIGQELQGVDIAQAQEQYQTEEQQKQRDYGTSERESGQKFASGERAAAQGFATAERLGSQEFAAKEAGISRNSQEKMFNKDYTLKRDQFNENLRMNKDQFAKTYGLQVQRAGHEDAIDSFNQQMATRTQAHNEKPGAMEKLFSASTYSKPFTSSGNKSDAGTEWKFGF